MAIRVRAAQPAGTSVPSAASPMAAIEATTLARTCHGVMPSVLSTPISPTRSRVFSTAVLNRILGKLDLRDRVQAVVLAYETGLVQPGSGSPS